MQLETKNKIGIVMATRLEANPFIKNLEFTQIEEKPFSIYSNTDIILIISGIGKSNAAMAVTYLVNKFNIKTLINAGAAGSTIINNNIGEIFQINKIIELDRIDVRSNKTIEYDIDVFDSYPNAILATQDRPVIDVDARKKVSNFAQLVDMEGAGFIHACRKFGAKGQLYKIITDTPMENTSTSIVKNIKNTRNILFDFIIKKLLKNNNYM